MCSPKQVEEADHRKMAGLRGRDRRRAENRSSLRPRAPMLLFEFDGRLFQLDAREPAFAPLSQLPPRIATPTSTHPLQPPPFADLIQPPIIFPISARCPEATLCWFIVMILRAGEARKRSQNRRSARLASAE